MSSQKVKFETSDKIPIAADYYEPPEPSAKGVVLVHMMPATRSSWATFAEKLQSQNYHVLAIDLRGHGESGGGHYRMFNDTKHQASILDLDGAAKFLQSKKATELVFTGASIGANLCLQYLSEHPETKMAVLLSPGLNYRGIKLEPLAQKVNDKNRILLVAADDDLETTQASCAQLQSILGTSKSICFQHGGHGTNLFLTHLDLADKIIKLL